MMLNKTLLVTAVWLVLCLTEQPAYAYIDPGTGSLIYQAALTMLLGVAFVLRRSRASISRFVRRVSGRDTASDSVVDSRD